MEKVARALPLPWV